MSLNPLRLVKSLWTRPHSATYTMKGLDSGGHEDSTQGKEQANDTLQDEQAQKEEVGPGLFHTSPSNNAKTSTSVPLPHDAGTSSGYRSLDGRNESLQPDVETSGGSQRYDQGHGHHESISSATTLGHENETNEHQRQSYPVYDQQTDNPPHGCRGEQVPEVSSDDDYLPSSHPSSDPPPNRRRKLTPKPPLSFKKAMTSAEGENIPGLVIEKLAANDPLPECYQCTHRGTKLVKPSLKLTGSCGVESDLHNLICGHLRTLGLHRRYFHTSSVRRQLPITTVRERSFQVR